MAYGIDSTGDNRLITAFFDDRSAATRAVERLVALGVPESQVRLTEGASTGSSATTTTEHRSGGFLDALADLFMPDEDRYTYAEGLRRGGYMVSATVGDGYYDRAIDILDDDGTVDLSERESTWRSEGWTGYDANRSDMGDVPLTESMGVSGTRTTGTGATGMDSAGMGTGLGATGGFGSGATARASDSGYDTGLTGRDEAIPVVEERLRVGKRDVNHGRVRIRSYVIEQPVHESVNLRQEHVDIERRPVDRAVTAGDDLFRERTIEVEERGEEAVVSKEARVVEEVRLRKDATERTDQIDDTVRRTEVEIEDDRGVRRDPLNRGL
ncbi:YsnF/AvaK domain-containing protein [Chthonobacter rhizosphaerae]|uniref:YsnF/AvaK domain-containing protein n=1 Tax=Chthonobacter rhizosphaerae TaxID=2735553 RepID=UPI0015EEC899|nr:YsnF/AvaK domain-containing protein [Chthonobacter rhizosphaerae]